jgi:hypothetical protein
MPRWFKAIAWLGGLTIAASVALAWLPVPSKTQPDWGVTFNAAYATYLGLDWKETFLAARDDLGVKHWRLSAPWDEIEAKRGQYDFSQLDWMLSQVANSGGTATLAIGRRTPRWPECHDPAWLAEVSPAEQRNLQLAMVAALVQRYRGNPAISMWQVENEMSLGVFGNCPTGDLAFFRQEVALVRSLDSAHRPVATTVSGELSRWGMLAREVDQLGSSLYRSTYNENWGYFTYPYPALFYELHAWLTKARTGTPVYISELQMEPWGRLPLVDEPVQEQLAEMGARQ